MAIPTIETERLILRPLRLDDLNDLFEYAQDEEVARPGMWEPYPSFEACREHLEQLVASYSVDLMWWGVEHRQDRKLIGRVDLALWSRQNARAEIGYALHWRYWRQGLMTEAARVVADYGWSELKLHRLGATVLGSNAGSIRVLQKLGMSFEGRLKDHRFHWGEWVDVDVYGVVRPDGFAR